MTTVSDTAERHAQAGRRVALRVGQRPTFFVIGQFLCRAVSNPRVKAGRVSRGMDGNERIEGLITPTIAAMGYEIVRVHLSGGRRPVLQVMAERLDGAAMSVDDCADISRTVSALLDVEDPISGAYNLEVSSPGIDRPLTRLKDFARYAGFEARIETKGLIDGRRRFKGILKGVTGETVRLEVEGGLAELPFGGILRAKLVLTDALMAAGV